MGVTYTKDDTDDVMDVNYKTVQSGRPPFVTYTHTTQRGFMRFDTSSMPAVGDITDVVLRLRCTGIATAGGCDICLHSSTTDTWGDDLDATEADFTSTDTNLEDTKSVTSTGSYDFDVDKNNLNDSGDTHFRLRTNNANSGEGATFATQDHSTQSYRPQLIITYTTAAGRSQVIIFG